MDFLAEKTDLELQLCGDGFYAAHREKEKRKPAMILRADYDALALPEGGAAHLCGHDGHSAALCGVALLLEGQQAGRDVFLLFQPAEETGEGAAGCTEIFTKENVREIYGAHNLPGIPFGQVTTRPGTFACASRGVTLILKGKATHAACPENGISPAEAVGHLLCELSDVSASRDYRGMVLCTVIGVQMGEKAFGAAAADAQIWLTLRAEHDADLEKLYRNVLRRSGELALQYRLEFTHTLQDVFPSTENDAVCAEKVLKACGGTLLETPMRWSEDFGHYLKRCTGAFFGIGSGTEHAPLHTEHYEYPDELLEPTVRAFWQIICS
ncbi:MAG: M20/M25/M40 family metallo-hydrolase [Lachnospiraceae bacterium]